MREKNAQQRREPRRGTVEGKVYRHATTAEEHLRTTITNNLVTIVTTLSIPYATMQLVQITIVDCVYYQSYLFLEVRQYTTPQLKVTL